MTSSKCSLSSVRLVCVLEEDGSISVSFLSAFSFYADVIILPVVIVVLNVWLFVCLFVCSKQSDSDRRVYRTVIHRWN